MTLPHIQAICFDMDGLLFNTEDLYDELAQVLLSRRGRNFDPELVRRMTGLQAEQAFGLFIEHYDLDDTVEELKDESSAWFRTALPDRLELMPGAAVLLEFLSLEAKRPLALTTSSSRASVDEIMSLQDIRSHFSFFLTAEDIQQSKPHPEIYESAAMRFDVAVENMLVFEDSENGCRSGVAARANVVAVPSKQRHDFSGSLLVAESLEDRRIYELLEGNGS